MFSSENNNNYPLLYDHSPSLANNNVIPENNSNFFQHHHGKYGYILSLPPTFSPIQDNHIAKLSIEPSIYHQQNSILYPSNMITSRSRRAPGKKDRHTKISTAQGVRDRRVRLSISIARDFFNLQDMLGFDKASTTVGWLMAKSKAAINELTSTSNKKNEEKNIEDTNVVDDGGGGKEAIDVKSCTNKKRNRRNSLNALNATMEMKRREEARNRARERTRKKKFGGGGGGGDMNQLQQQHQSIQQDLMIFQSISGGTLTNGVISNRISSKDDQESCNYNNDYFNKFTSESSSNYGGIAGLNIINLSEIHINDRSWDN